MMDIKEALAAPLEDLPTVEFAFAYGSGVFQQAGSLHISRNEAPMVDYILGVKAPVLWHSENLKKNPRHYSSWLACFGGKAVSLIADKIGAGVHFNAFVPWRGKMIKYGVIGMDYLTQDILSWKTLYISGRLQKPVRILVDDWAISRVNQVNLQAAASAALLLLPAEFSEEEFYEKVCGLSYMGDVRMLFAEDKNKVQRIVQGSAEHFHTLYHTPLCHLAALGLLELPRSYGGLGSILRRDCSPHAVESLVSSLPTTVLHKLVSNTGMTSKSGMGVFLREPSQPVQRAISSVVRTSSMKQLLSGLLAAGGTNSMRYVWKKATKAWRSRS